MIRNYLNIAKRILLKRAVYSLLNILGLAIGIAASALIFHYIHYEKSFDKYHNNSENIYRLTYGRLSENGEDVEFASACPVIAPLLKENFPEIKEIARMAVREATFSYGENKFIEDKVYYVEQNILDILHFNIIDGNPEGVLEQPNKALINKTIAEKYFGKSNPIGKSLKLNRKESFEVVGVFEDVPSNSHLKPEILLSFPNLTNWRGKDYLQSWGHTGAFTYLVLNPDANLRELEKRFIEFTKLQISELLEQYNLIMYFNLQPIESIHLNSHLLQEQEVNGDKKIVNFMYIIGIFILVIAWANYINLTTSRSIERAREVGVRKVTGANRKNLLTQFYTESAVINFLSIILSGVLIELFMSPFENITGVTEQFNIWNQSWFILFLVLIFLFGTFITGMYPAFALSSFKPVQIIKGKFITNNSKINLRKVLIIFQLVISMVLITATFTVFKQIKYLKNQNLGFDINRMLVINIPKVIDSTYVSRQRTFKNEIMKLSGTKGVAFSTEVPGRKIWWDNGGIYKVGLTSSDGKNYMIMGVDENFIGLYKMKFVVGRNFSKDFPSDKQCVLLNETAVKWLEFKNPEDALNSQINYWDNIYTIIGILKDYNHESPKASPEPQIFRYLPDIPRGYFSVKLKPGQTEQIIKNIEIIWEKLFSGNPYEYFFLDTYYNEQFKSDKRFGKLFSIFSFLAIFITCMGLFGLSLYSVLNRTKEIGIRKVHGATSGSVIRFIIREYLILILIAMIVAIPVSFWGIKEWLTNFPVKMPVNLWLFLIPVLMVVIITIISVAAQTVRAAQLNPVDSIKYE